MLDIINERESVLPWKLTSLGFSRSHWGYGIPRPLGLRLLVNQMTALEFPGAKGVDEVCRMGLKSKPGC
jgi:hypothetical protein